VRAGVGTKIGFLLWHLASNHDPIGVIVNSVVDWKSSQKCNAQSRGWLKGWLYTPDLPFPRGEASHKRGASDAVCVSNWYGLYYGNRSSLISRCQVPRLHLSCQ
jgi:hypothetical protein